MKKRLASLLMALLMVLGVLPLSACGGRKAEEAAPEETISRGEMLNDICEAFGMYEYQQQTPYLSSVTSTDPYFTAVQTCVEWEVIGTEDQSYDVNQAVTRGELALAVVNAANLASEDATEEERIDVAASYALVEISSGSVVTDETVTPDEETKAIVIAQSLWAEAEFETPVEEITYQDGVVDCSTDAGTYAEGGVVYVPITAGRTLEAGDCFVYRNEYGQLTATKAASVTEENGYYAVVQSDEDFELDDLCEDLVVQETYSPDLSKAIFEDGAGNVYYPDSTSTGVSGVAANGLAVPQATFLTATGSEPLNANGMLLNPNAKIGQTALGSDNLKFKVGDYEIELKLSGDSISVGFKKPTEKDSKGNTISSVGGSVKVGNIRMTNDIDYSVWSGLKRLQAKIDYSVKITGSASTTWADKIAAPYNNGNGGFLTNLLRSEVRDISAAGADSITSNYENGEIKIGSWTLVEGGVVQVKLELKLNFKVTGEISASLTLSGAKGVEYRNGNFRIIKENSTDQDLTFKCKAQATAKFGFSLKLLNKWDLLGAYAVGGVGGEASATVHMIDAERHLIETYDGDDLSLAGLEANGSINVAASPNALLTAAAAQGVDKIQLPTGDVTLNTEVCIDLCAYWIVKLEIKPEKFLKNLTKWSGYEHEFFNKENATFLKYHVEDFDFLHPVEECTKKYTPFEYLDDGTEDDVGATDADKLDLTAYFVMLDTEPQKLELELDEDETAPAVIWESEDPSVATVSDDGTVTPVSAGTTIITVRLQSDESVCVKCAVTVSTFNESKWEFLPADTGTNNDDTTDGTPSGGGFAGGGGGGGGGGAF